MPCGELELFGVEELGDVVAFGVVGEVGDVVDDGGELERTVFLVLGAVVVGEVAEVTDERALFGPVCVPGAMAVRGPRGTPGAVGADVDDDGAVDDGLVDED